MEITQLYLLLVLLWMGNSSLNAQEFTHSDRCYTKQSSNSKKFEAWLKSKRFSKNGNPDEIYKIPIVVHILHHGEPIGEGSNHSIARIEAQIQRINEDFRRKTGTLGHNLHPDGGDAKIEFVLAKSNPQGNATNGIVRINMNDIEVPPISLNNILWASKYSYWPPEDYLNIWSMPIPGLPDGTLLGEAKMPVSDLEGLPDEFHPDDADGVFIRAPYFGNQNPGMNLSFNLGRTLTHEIGHFLGLLHIWGGIDGLGNCEINDFCADTPPTDNFTSGCPSPNPTSCDDRPKMIENYMDYSHDACMNIFTKDQISRMRTVLENSPRRKSLLTSPGLEPPVTTGLPELDHKSINIYPNPVLDRIYIQLDTEQLLKQLDIIAYSLSGKVLFTRSFENHFEGDIELFVPKTKESVIILHLKSDQFSWSKKLIIK